MVGLVIISDISLSVFMSGIVFGVGLTKVKGIGSGKKEEEEACLFNILSIFTWWVMGCDCQIAGT